MNQQQSIDTISSYSAVARPTFCQRIYELAAARDECVRGSDALAGHREARSVASHLQEYKESKGGDVVEKNKETE